MSDETKRTLRTALQIIIFAAASLPVVLETSGLSEQIPGVAGALAVALAITRVMQTSPAQRVLKWIGLDVTPSTPTS